MHGVNMTYSTFAKLSMRPDSFRLYQGYVLPTMNPASCHGSVMYVVAETVECLG